MTGSVSFECPMRNRAEGPYTLSISGRDSWPAQYFVYDHVKRRNLIAKLVKTPKTTVNAQPQRVTWEFDLFDWHRVFGAYDSHKLSGVLKPFIQPDDFRSEDVLTHITSSRSRFRFCNLGAEIRMHLSGRKPPWLENECWFIHGGEFTQEERDFLAHPLNISQVSPSIVLIREEGKTLCDYVIKKGRMPYIEKYLFEQPNPMLITYGVTCALSGVIKGNPLIESMSGLRELTKYYAPAHRAIEEGNRSFFLSQEVFSDLRVLNS